MGAYEQALERFLDGEKSGQKGKGRESCTDERIVRFDVERLVNGEDFRMDNQKVSIFVKSLLLFYGILANTFFEQRINGGPDGRWHNLQIQVQIGSKIKPIRDIKRLSSAGHSISKSSTSTATTATLLVQEGCTASAARIRAAWYHVAFPYRQGTYNKGKLYRGGRVTKFDDVVRTTEIEWDGKEGGVDDDDDDDDDDEPIMGAPGPVAWKDRRMTDKEKRDRKFLEQSKK